MSTSHLASPKSVQLPGLPNFTEASAQSQFGDSGFRIELAFLNRSSQWLYRLQQGMKRAVDLLGASLGMVLISPLLLGIALLIKITSEGPVLYKSRRIGKNYQPFDMYKFRTMCTDADAKRDALREQANLQGDLFKLENDPRVTAIGKILRALSLDELPQLLNVIRGEMSLVGPRPLPPDESQLFEDPYTLRFQVYPGMTGKWQVSGRSKLRFDQLCRLEMDYVLRWTLLSDLEILFKTLPAVLASRGAF
ncbi:MAG: exopolysaccharide biosynthesis polyprenyl glycosylphosphotransferase [Vampirovibrio sp.]|jgi:lipopolysaccharide/colanic/teichoic acid biosynthesis glycosyltransferase|nr:exopolysaccharide biosynthesis polyprenyl glycosylphosphotransferase [Vampirovibrio sp.]